MPCFLISTNLQDDIVIWRITTRFSCCLLSTWCSVVLKVYVLFSPSPVLFGLGTMSSLIDGSTGHWLAGDSGLSRLLRLLIGLLTQLQTGSQGGAVHRLRAELALRARIGMSLKQVIWKRFLFKDVKCFSMDGWTDALIFPFNERFAV